MVRWTIRRKLMSILLLLTASSIFFVGFRAYEVSRKALERRIGVGLHRQALNMTEQLDRILFERYQNVQNWSTHEIMTDILLGDPNGNIRDFLTTMKDEYGIYADLVFADVSGKVIAASRPKLKGKDVSQEKWFQQSFTQRGVKTHSLHFSKLVGQSVVTFASPVRTDLMFKAPDPSAIENNLGDGSVVYGEFEAIQSRTIGVLAAFLDWAQVISIINSMTVLDEEEQHQGAYAMLIDHHGVALTQPYFDESAVILHEDLVSLGIDAAKKATNGESGYTIETGRYNSEDFIGYAATKGIAGFQAPGWSVLVFQSTSEALRPIRNLQLQILGIAFLVVIIVGFIAYFLARGISNPIVKLALITNSIAKGDFSGRVEVESKDEIGLLAEAFNDMTTEIQKANIDLVKAKDFTDNIIKSTTDALIVIRHSGLIQTCNPAVKTILGFDEEDLISKPFQTVLSVENEEHKKIEEALQAGTLNNVEVSFKTKEGDPKALLASATAMKDENGNSQGIVLIAKDITEYKELEQQFLHAQKLDAIGRLAGGVAHDFNNMLTIIKIYSERLMRKLAEDNPQHKDVEQVLLAANRGARLVRQLLSFSRKQVTKAEVIKLPDLIKDMTKMLTLLTGENVEIVIDVPRSVGAIKADSGQIEQVLANLVNNARDAMDAKGKIEIKAYNKTLSESAALPLNLPVGEYVVLAVKDNGSGMPESVQKKIFDPFFTTKEKGKGTGLGLATCYGIITQSGGQIKVDSVEGEGTTFEVYLPKIENDGTGSVMAEELKELPRGEETILIAEDEIDLRKVAAQALREHGYTVLEASNGVEAMNLVKKNGITTIDLVVSDLAMPQMGGRDLIHQLTDLRSDLKVLFAAAYRNDPNEASEEDDEDYNTDYNTGDTSIPFLQKPYSEAQLIRKVREVLDS